MNLKYKISSSLHSHPLYIGITTTAHLMLVFLNAPQDFVLKIITGARRNLICQFLIKVVYELLGLLPVEFYTFIS